MENLEFARKFGWVAGTIEGEGWIGLRRNNSPEVQVISTDRDVVDRLLEWTGLGSISGPHDPSGLSVKPTYRWHVTRRDDAATLLEALLPLMGERRADKIAEVLAAYHAAPPTRGTSSTCGYGHELTPENLRMVDGRRRCLKCQARRQRECRARSKVDNAMIVA